MTSEQAKSRRLSRQLRQSLGRLALCVPSLVAAIFLLAATIPSMAQTVPLGPRFALPFQTVVDQTGTPLPGAMLNFYASGTSTRLTTYSDPLLTIPNPNPVVASAAGVFPSIFMAGNYKVVLTDFSGNQIWTADPVDGIGAVALSQGGTVVGGGTNGGLLWNNNGVLGVNVPGAHLSINGAGALSVDATGTGILATKGDIGVALPSLTTSQLYGGTGAPGAAQAFPLGSNVSPALQVTLNAANGLAGLDASAYLKAAQFPALTGDVTTPGGSLATTIAANAVTNAKAAQMAADTVKCNGTGSLANAADCTVAQMIALLGPFEPTAWFDVQGAYAGNIANVLAAANAAGGGVLYFAPGVTFAASNGPYTIGPNISVLCGAGANIQTNSPTADIFDVTGDNDDVDGCTFSTSILRTAGDYVYLNSASAHLKNFRMFDAFIDIGISATTADVEGGYIRGTTFAAVQGLLAGDAHISHLTVNQGFSITGTISATTLTVTVANSLHTIAVGDVLSGGLAGTHITALGSGSGGTGTYTVDQSQTATITEDYGPGHGILLSGNGGAPGCAMTLSDSAILEGAESIFVQPPSGGTVFLLAVNDYLDNAGNWGVFIQPTGTGTIGFINVLNSEIGPDGVAGSGFYIDLTYGSMNALGIADNSIYSYPVSTGAGITLVAGAPKSFRIRDNDIGIQGSALAAAISFSIAGSSNAIIGGNTLKGSSASFYLNNTADKTCNFANDNQIVGGGLSAGCAWTRSQITPTISSGFGTSPSVTNFNGSAGFEVNVGTGGSASSGVVGLGTALNGWNCSAVDITTQSATVFQTKQTASTTASATFANYNTSGAAAAWAASDKLRITCTPY
jgi:hypothetical protein